MTINVVSAIGASTRSTRERSRSENAMTAIEQQRGHARLHRIRVRCCATSVSEAMLQIEQHDVRVRRSAQQRQRGDIRARR